jgi:SAM-dependent methyltransferase
VTTFHASVRDALDRLRWHWSSPGDSQAEKQLARKWRTDELAPLRGWDFSYVREGIHEFAPQWDYIGLARSLVANSSCVLDMATGGGEIYSDILTPRPNAKCFACEGYRKNVSVAREALKASGVEVRESKSVNQLPFESGQFDVVLNQHGGFDANEITRILAPGGVFLSQQINSQNLHDLRIHFDRSTDFQVRNHDVLRRRLLDAGFTLEREEQWQGDFIVTDIGALVYFLHHTPWIVPNFSVAKFFPKLLELHAQCLQQAKLVFTSFRSLYVARKV